MEILFENQAFWVVRKPAGKLSESDNGKGPADELAAQNRSYVGVVHRLDREVGGITVYAKTPEAAALLSEQIRTHRLKKEYVALVAGTFAEPEGEWRDLLFYDRTKNKVFPVKRERRGVKEAILRYRVERTATLPELGAVALVAVEPITGRTHQIRVQFASRGHAVVGDRRYGGAPLPAGMEKGQILLSCRRIAIPASGNEQVFCEDPDWIAELL